MRTKKSITIPVGGLSDIHWWFSRIPPPPPLHHHLLLLFLLLLLPLLQVLLTTEFMFFPSRASKGWQRVVPFSRNTVFIRQNELTRKGTSLVLTKSTASTKTSPGLEAELFDFHKMQQQKKILPIWKKRPLQCVVEHYEIVQITIHAGQVRHSGVKNTNSHSKIRILKH